MSETRKRQAKCVRSFIFNDGSEAARSGPGVTAVKLSFPDRDETQVMELGSLSEDIIYAAAAFGLATSVTNTFGAADMSVDDAIEAAASRWEVLSGGQWSGERETGMRTGLLLEAAGLLAEKAGKPWGQEQKDAFAAKLLSGERTAKSLQSNAAFAAALEDVKSRKQEERRKRAAEKAGESTADLSFLD